VRLALARYQPNSLWDMYLSPVVVADFIQTAPNRTLTVTRNAAQPGTYNLALSGPGYTARRDLHNNVIAGSGLVEVSLQRRDPRLEDEALGWVAPPGGPQPVSLTAQVPAADGVVTWNGQIAVPAPDPGERRRLVIREYQLIPSDDILATGQPRLVHRLVYADTIEL
jgi:hypothetical protein